jgi:hypothetical protein
MHSKFLSENLKIRDYSEDLSIDRMIILECILRKLGEKLWIGFIWLSIGTTVKL